MKHTIYTKLLISYLIYGVIAFFIICTFTQHLTTDYIEKQEASNLYREASIIAGDYANEYFGSSMSLSDFQNHMKIVADYMDAPGWLVLDFLAETLYMHVDSAGVADIFIAPYVVQKLLPCKHLIWR